MKKFLFLLATVGLFVVACQKGEQEGANDGDGPGNSGGGYSHSIELSETDVVMPSESGSYSVTVNSTCSWSATSSAGWITVNTKTGTAGSKQLSFSVQANNSGSSRQGTIVIKDADYNLTVQLSVVQEASNQGGNNGDNGDDNGDNGGNSGTKEKRLTRIASYNPNDEYTSTVDYAYDNQGRLIKAVSVTDQPSSSITYTYWYEWGDKTISVKLEMWTKTATNSTKNTLFYDYTLNSQGLVQTCVYTLSGNNDYVVRYTYNYNASNRITGMEYNDSYSIRSYVYVWEEDNITSSKIADNTYECTMTYGGEPYNKKGYFIQGATVFSDGILASIYPELFGVRSKQLPIKSRQITNKGTQYQTETESEYTYEFDRDGYISKTKTTSNGVTYTTTLTWE